MIVVRILWWLVSCLLFELVDIPLMLLGWIVIPIAAAYKAYELVPNEKDTRNIYHLTWKWMFVWDNFEDGIWNNSYWQCPPEARLKFFINLKLFSISCDLHLFFINQWWRDFFEIVLWSANRNPTNNLRLVSILSFKLDPLKVGFRGSFTHTDAPFNLPHGVMKDSDWDKNTRLYDTKVPQWFFAWHGLYSTFYWQFMFFGKLKRFWWGWKIYPTDVYGVTPYREKGVGFSLEFKTV